MHGSIGYGPPQVACYVLSGAWHGNSMERKHGRRSRRDRGWQVFEGREQKSVTVVVHLAFLVALAWGPGPESKSDEFSG